jgi:hypothetical protein
MVLVQTLDTLLVAGDNSRDGRWVEGTGGAEANQLDSALLRPIWSQRWPGVECRVRQSKEKALR